MFQAPRITTTTSARSVFLHQPPTTPKMYLILSSFTEQILPPPSPTILFSQTIYFHSPLSTHPMQQSLWSYIGLSLTKMELLNRISKPLGTQFFPSSVLKPRLSVWLWVDTNLSWILMSLIGNKSKMFRDN